MRYTVFLFLFLGVTASAFSQDRQRALADFNEMKLKAAAIERVVLAPDDSDKAAAAQQSASAVRIMPRETYDNSFSSIRGGGSYYSFVRKTHEYGFGSDIELQQNYLSVGFAGRDYGFLIDLGNAPLTGDIKDLKNLRGLDFLINYKPADHPRAESQTRSSEGYKIDELVYKNRIPAVVGHTYALRSIGSPESDIVVAFTVRRKDEDGSIIIFWRLIEDFSKSPGKNVAKTPMR